MPDAPVVVMAPAEVTPPFAVMIPAAFIVPVAPVAVIAPADETPPVAVIIPVEVKTPPTVAFANVVSEPSNTVVRFLILSWKP